ncbi:MAG: hypothetical protein ACXW5U_32375 [Thermoanaerobaculia bacterium]
MKSLLAALAAAALVSSISCATNPQARTAAAYNAKNIQRVTLGASMVSVLVAMGREPEIRFRQVQEGNVVEQWSYVTDYERDVVTTLTFEDRHVTAIRQEPWNGTYSRDTIGAHEDLSSPDDPVSPYIRGQAAVNQLERIIKPGDRIDDVRARLGDPQHDTMGVENGRVTALLYYTKANGEQWVITVQNGRVVRAVQARK